MRRTTPPILNDRRISCFVTTMPLVSMGGTAGPWLACWMRTGVGLRGLGRLAACRSRRAARPVTATATTSRRCHHVVFIRFIGSVQRQGARGSGVVELGLAREHFETRDVEIELGAGEARARIDEFDLADRALVALAAGDAERRARGLGARIGGGQRVGAGVEPVERLLDFELHLLRELIELRRGLARGGVGLAHRGAARAAVEEGPVEQQRDRGVVAAAAELVFLALDAAIGAERQRRPAARPSRRCVCASLARVRCASSASSGRLSSAAWRSSASARVVAVTSAADLGILERRVERAVQQEIEVALRLRGAGSAPRATAASTCSSSARARSTWSCVILPLRNSDSLTRRFSLSSATLASTMPWCAPTPASAGSRR